MFEPGITVVCVDDKFPDDIRDYYNALPVKGRNYTVRDIVPGIAFNGAKGQVTVYLVELVNLPNIHGIEPGFLCQRFAELEEVGMVETVREYVEGGSMSKPDLDKGIVATDHASASPAQVIIRRWRGKVRVFSNFKADHLTDAQLSHPSHVKQMIKAEPWKFAESINTLDRTTLMREGLV